MRSKAGLLRELRQSIVSEHMQEGKPKEWAEKLATDDIKVHEYVLRKRSVLRLAVRQSRF